MSNNGATKTSLLKTGQKAVSKLAEFDNKLQKTQKAFPLLNLIYSATFLFGENGYDRVVNAYKNPFLTKLLSDYIESIFYKNSKRTDWGVVFHSPDIRHLTDKTVKDMILKYSGIGVTDKMRADYAEYNRRSVNSPNARLNCRVGPGGLHPNALAAMYGYKDGAHLGGTVMKQLFKEIFSDHEQAVQDIVDAYVHGDLAGMLKMFPESERKQYESKYRNMYKIPDNVPTDELNIAGKWLADNFTTKR